MCPIFRSFFMVMVIRIVVLFRHEAYINRNSDDNYMNRLCRLIHELMPTFRLAVRRTSQMTQPLLSAASDRECGEAIAVVKAKQRLGSRHCEWGEKHQWPRGRRLEQRLVCCPATPRIATMAHATQKRKCKLFIPCLLLSCTLRTTIMSQATWKGKGRK